MNNWIMKISSQVFIDLEAYRQNLQDFLYNLANDGQTNPRYSYTTEEADRDYERILNITVQNMQNISSRISQAAKRIDSWHNYPIRIEPNPSGTAYESENYSEPADDAIIYIGTDKWAPSFTWFSHDNNVMLEDILEAGDSDFFTDPRLQQDYFLLLQEIKSPGSTAQPGKILSLYTARPVRDRETYMNANKIPVGLFLTANLERARGIARDLSGREKFRDVWRVQIEERYLNQTLDSGYIKDYQVVGNDFVTVKSMTLVDAGE